MINMSPDKETTGMKKGLDSDTFPLRSALLLPLYYSYILTYKLDIYGNTSFERPVRIYFFLLFCSSISCICTA